MNDLRSIRHSAGLTQDNLAQLTGLSQPHIASIEAGVVLPRKRTRKRIEGLLGAEIDWQQTLSSDKEHVTRQMIEMLNLQAEGVLERIGHVKRVLHTIEQNLKPLQ